MVRERFRITSLIFTDFKSHVTRKNATISVRKKFGRKISQKFDRLCLRNRSKTKIVAESQKVTKTIILFMFLQPPQIATIKRIYSIKN